MAQELTKSAINDASLRRCEAVISKHLPNMRQLGEALLEIRNDFLYLNSYPSFKAYCEGKWGITDRWARKLIEVERAEKLLDSRAGRNSVPPPLQTKEKDNESEASDDETDNSSRDSGSRSGEVIHVDKTGYSIPAKALPLWNRSSEASAVVKKVKDAHRAVQELIDKGDDLLYAEVNLQAAVIELEPIIANLERAIPYTVCTYCNAGAAMETCTACKGRGMFSEMFFRQAIPKEMKAKRAK